MKALLAVSFAIALFQPVRAQQDTVSGSGTRGGDGTVVYRGRRVLIEEALSEGCLWQEGAELRKSLSGWSRYMAALNRVSPVYGARMARAADAVRVCRKATLLPDFRALGLPPAYAMDSGGHLSALRWNQNIYIFEPHFARLSTSSKILLFIHELWHGQVNPGMPGDEEERVRDLTYGLRQLLEGSLSPSAFRKRLIANRVAWPTDPQALADLSTLLSNQADRESRFKATFRLAGEIKSERAALDPYEKGVIEQGLRDARQAMRKALFKDFPEEVKKLTQWGFPASRTMIGRVSEVEYRPGHSQAFVENAERQWLESGIDPNLNALDYAVFNDEGDAMPPLLERMRQENASWRATDACPEYMSLNSYFIYGGPEALELLLRQFSHVGLLPVCLTDGMSPLHFLVLRQDPQLILKLAPLLQKWSDFEDHLKRTPLALANSLAPANKALRDALIQIGSTSASSKSSSSGNSYD